VFVATPAVAQGPFLSLSTNEGAAGSSFTASWGGFTTCRGPMQILFDKTVVATPPAATKGSITASVPGGTAPGKYLVVASNLCQSIARQPFTVIFVPPTTTQPPPPPVITDPPVVITTKPPVITTTTTPPTTTTTTETTTTTTETTSSTTSTGTSSRGDGALTLDKDNIQPGDPLTATGTGCKPDSDVKLSSLNEDVGRARADNTGRFSTAVEFSTIQPGRHVIRAECGIVLVGSVDVALTTSSSGGTTSTLVVLVFFLLIGATMLRRQFSGIRLPKPN
jgi:hypothetical protein